VYLPDGDSDAHGFVFEMQIPGGDDIFAAIDGGSGGGRQHCAAIARVIMDVTGQGRLVDESDVVSVVAPAWTVKVASSATSPGGCAVTWRVSDAGLTPKDVAALLVAFSIGCSSASSGAGNWLPLPGAWVSTSMPAC
jgi:hypothetical protein